MIHSVLMVANGAVDFLADTSGTMVGAMVAYKAADYFGLPPLAKMAVTIGGEIAGFCATHYIVDPCIDKAVAELDKMIATSKANRQLLKVARETAKKDKVEDTKVTMDGNILVLSRSDGSTIRLKQVTDEEE